MAKLKSPVLSLDARGQIGKSMVFSAWRGVKYARQLVVPANPRTTEQTKTRTVFAMLDETWKRVGTLGRAPWIAESDRRPMTPRNAFFRGNLSALRGQTDMTNFVGSPGARSGLPPTNISANTGAAAGEIDVTLSVPSEPSGWTLDGAIFQAQRDHDPHDLPTEFLTEDETASPTPGSDVSLTLSGLTTGADYVLTGWTRWTRPDGRTAYGASLTVPNVVTAG